MHPHKAAAESSAKVKHGKIMKACGGSMRKAGGGPADKEATFDERFGKQPPSWRSDDPGQQGNQAQDTSRLPNPLMDQGKKRGGRLDRKYARGGRTKSHTHVNVVVAPQGGKEPVPVPVGGGMGAPMPPRPPVAPPVAGGMPGGAPGGPPMPMRAKGGRVHPKPSYPKPKYTKANKGYPLDSGSLTGEGRLEKIEAYGKAKR